jgi:hypothetical protein
MSENNPRFTGVRINPPVQVLFRRLVAVARSWLRRARTQVCTRAVPDAWRRRRSGRPGASDRTPPSSSSPARPPPRPPAAGALTAFACALGRWVGPRPGLVPSRRPRWRSNGTTPFRSRSFLPPCSLEPQPPPSLC